MNLGRAKTVLIIAFLGLNLFLCYQLFWGDMLAMSQLAVTTEQIESTKDKLASAGYYLDTDLERSMRTSAFLTVKPSVDPAREIARRAVGQASSIAGETGIIHYTGTEAQAFLYPGGYLQIVFETPLFLSEGCRNMEEKKLVSLVEQYLEERQMKPEVFRFDFIKTDGDGQTTLQYYQTHDGMPLFAGYLKVHLHGDCISEVEMFMLDPVEWPPEKKMEVIPVTEALLRMAQELGPSPVPCYLVKAELGFFSPEYDAEKWEVPPVWRFLTGDGKSFYINAFTGNLEID